MPEDGRMNLAAVVPPADQSAGRHDRPSLVGFLTDRDTEEALREGLAEATSETLDLRRGGIRAAISTMQKFATPRVLVVDITGEEQPLSALGELSHVVEPDVCVLVVGEVEHADFYREITRGLGAAEYLSKPVTREKVLRHFGPFAQGSAFATPAMLGGRAIAITGVRGGVGATTIAVNLAWHFGVNMRRHTMLLDPDTHLGATAFLLNIQPGPGLRMALESPDRIDSLLAERAAQPAADRLHVLAAEEKIASMTSYADGAAQAVIGMSMGGATLLSLCDRHPDLVRRAVLVDVERAVGDRRGRRGLGRHRGDGEQAGLRDEEGAIVELGHARREQPGEGHGEDWEPPPHHAKRSPSEGRMGRPVM